MIRYMFGRHQDWQNGLGYRVTLLLGHNVLREQRQSTLFQMGQIRVGLGFVRSRTVGSGEFVVAELEQYRWQH